MEAYTFTGTHFERNLKSEPITDWVNWPLDVYPTLFKITPDQSYDNMALSYSSSRKVLQGKWSKLMYFRQMSVRSPKLYTLTLVHNLEKCSQSWFVSVEILNGLYSGTVLYFVV